MTALDAAIEHLIRDADTYDDDVARWAAAELRRQNAEIERLTRYLVSIRDTGMSAPEAAEHAADALAPNF